jgi:hypothetical protein
MKIVNDNILNVKKGYILHQCNCVTLDCIGLAKSLELYFPDNLPYKNRKKFGTKNDPGTVYISGADPYIVNIFGQYLPGKPTITETKKVREKYFEDALDAFVDFLDGTEEIVLIAIPYKIGCGLAGGNWNNYLDLILKFEKKLHEMNIKNEITIYKLD